MTPDELTTSIRERIRQLGDGVGDTEGRSGFAVDFYNAVLADPDLEGTGFFPTIEEAMEAAGRILFVIDILALAALHDEPDIAESWPDPEGEAVGSWATIVSAARKGGDENGDPEVEERYDREGDQLNLNDVPGLDLTAEEITFLEQVVAEAEQRREHLFTEEGIFVAVRRFSPVQGGRSAAVDVICRRPERHTRLGRETTVNGKNALEATDEEIIRAVYGDQSIFDTGPAPVVTVTPTSYRIPGHGHMNDATYRVTVR